MDRKKEKVILVPLNPLILSKPFPNKDDAIVVTNLNIINQDDRQLTEKKNTDENEVNPLTIYNTNTTSDFKQMLSVVMDFEYDLLKLKKISDEAFQVDNTLSILKNQKEILIFESNRPKELDSARTEELIAQYKNEQNAKNPIYIDILELSKNLKNKQIFYEDEPLDNTNRREMEEIYQAVQKKHPTFYNKETYQDEQYNCCQCCSFKWICDFCYCNKEKDNEFKNIESGIKLYFFLLNLLIITFTVITILSIVPIVAFMTTHSERKAKDFFGVLFKTTIGNVESNSFNCYSFNVDILQNEYTFNLNCSSMNLYIGPIFPLEVRYAGILTNLVISLILGPGMPLLYIVFYINIIVTFLVDKYMILCYHRNPPHYNLNFTRIFIVITGIALLCHLFISIWIYGEPSLFVDLPSEYGEYVFKDKVKKRVTKYINIVYIGVAVISITFGVLFYWFKCRPVKIKKRRIIRRQKNMISFRLLIQKH